MSDIILSRSWEFHLDCGSFGTVSVFVPLDHVVSVVGAHGGNTDIHVTGKSEPFVVREDVGWVRDIVDCYNVFAPRAAAPAAAAG